MDYWNYIILYCIGLLKLYYIILFWIISYILYYVLLNYIYIISKSCLQSLWPSALATCFSPLLQSSHTWRNKTWSSTGGNACRLWASWRWHTKRKSTANIRQANVTYDELGMSKNYENSMEMLLKSLCKLLATLDKLSVTICVSCCNG